jgi:succinylglutamic semialdehyde dehydrogenase
MHKSFPSCTGELWLGNRWKLPKGAPLISTDPVYQLPLWKSKSAEAVDIDTGIQAAQQAFRAWSQQPHAAREAIIRSIKQELEFFKIPLAQSISEETGKPLWEATAEIQSTLKKLDVAIQSYQTRTGEHVQLMPFGDARLMHRPLGVIGVLGPFNFPLQIPLSQIISLLLAGNTVIFKPSEHTPRMGELIARLCEKAGIPPGVLNLIQGAGGVGALLAEHPRLAVFHRQCGHRHSATPSIWRSSRKNVGFGDGGE